ncbi:E3 ubiquitin-protein ligase ATL6 [Brachypodium distachyon]|uniref:RING-type E3 ubiquitin transferase n=1 Tax=Brachypodium distachyon TaxID=15368 RepID=I1IAS4_BRADI|nr:E3 ubiquitin-protein ligase ATL6 [Brachypodium distachyon]PNT68874.1 hypothetical protein BRADI_3g46510v3 [Brachypodium distachyon]|eukprot:XP_003572640.1 E3 ubiquitin-protein ligase ATL6 [Brachypodium distachyon]
MASSGRRSFVSAILPAVASCAAAQSAGANNSIMSFSNSMTVCFFVAILAFPILAVLLAFACLRLFRPPDDNDPTASESSSGGRPREGLDASEIAALPLVSYRDVKEHRISDGLTVLDPLECAVCLLEFEDDDSLRLLPTCPHAFHPECIGSWLERHVTCPLCRANVLDQAPKEPRELPLPPQETSASSSPPEAPPVHDDTVDVLIGAEDEDAARGRREARRQAVLPRSNSTGHERAGGRGMERFALRLPEHVRLEILMSHRLRHVTSAVASVRVREGSTHDYPGGVSVGGKPGRSAVARLLSLFAPGAGWKGDNNEDRSGASGSSRRWWRREQEKKREAIKKTEP